MLPDFKSKLIDKPGVPKNIWETSHTLLGTETFSFQILDYEFELRGIQSEIIPHLERLKMGAPQISIRKRKIINIWKSPYPQFNNVNFTNNVITVITEVEYPIFIHYNCFFAAKFNIETEEITIFGIEAKPVQAANDLENIMRVLSTLIFFPKNVFFFHSAAISVQGKTFVFFGPHAAGKSTISLLAPDEALVLGDDLNALILREKQLFVASLPFPSDVTNRRPIVQKKVDYLMRLNKGNNMSFTVITKPEKFAALYGSFPVLNTTKDILPIMKEKIETLIKRIPICRLTFPKTEEIYPWILENLSLIPE